MLNVYIVCALLNMAKTRKHYNNVCRLTNFLSDSEPEQKKLVFKFLAVNAMS